MKTYIESQLPRFIRDLSTIVNIDSPSTHIPGLRKLASFFRPRFEAIGMETRITEEGKQGVPCLTARTRQMNNRFDLLMIGHMDTVFPKDESKKRPFTIKDNRAMGPGVCDMKGGLLTALYALEALHHAKLLDRLAVCVIFNGDEEIGSLDSRPLIEEYTLISDRVFVFEACRKNFNYALERKGGGWITLTARGKAAHAGTAPEKGANAILEMAHQVLTLHGLNCSKKGTSAQATLVGGGHKENIVPDFAQLSIDIRVKTIEESEKINLFLKKLPLSPNVKGVSLSVEGSISRPPMVPDRATMRLWETIEKAGNSIGVTPRHTPRGGGSDGNFSAALGVPTIDGMGASGENAHTPDEYLDLNSVVPLISIAALACKSIADQTKG